MEEEKEDVFLNLFINGQIESASIPDEDGVNVKFDICTGKQWSLISGV